MAARYPEPGEDYYFMAEVDSGPHRGRTAILDAGEMRALGVDPARFRDLWVADAEDDETCVDEYYELGDRLLDRALGEKAGLGPDWPEIAGGWSTLLVPA